MGFVLLFVGEGDFLLFDILRPADFLLLYFFVGSFTFPTLLISQEEKLFSLPTTELFASSRELEKVSPEKTAMDKASNLTSFISPTVCV